MSAQRVILRGAPPAGRYRAPGRAYRGRHLTSRLCLHVVAAAASRTEGDRFGMAAVLVARGALLFHAVLVVPDETPPSTRGALDAWAEAHRVETAMGSAPWRVVTLSAFSDPRATRERAPWAFVPNAYTGRSTVVGPDLGRTFGLMAEHVVERRGAHRGAWEVWLPRWGIVGDAGNVYKASSHRPGLRVASRRVGWTVGFGPTERYHGKPTRGGEFVDLLSLAYALDADRGAGFVEHAANFDVGVAELPLAVTVDPAGAETMARAVTESLRLTLILDEHAGRWLTTPEARAEGTQRLPLARLQSPAALGDHLLRHVGVTAPHVTWRLRANEHRAWAEAFHGGWTESDPAFYAVPFRCAALDVRACYPLVAHHLGWWEMMTCARVERRRVTRQLRALCERAAHDPAVLLDPAVWHRFGLTLCEVVPDGEPFVVALDDPRRPDGRSEVVPLTCSGRTMFYAWPDVVAAAALSGRVPKIAEAVRLVPIGRQGGLRADVAVYPGLVCDAESDPVLGWVDRRRCAKAQGDATLAAQLHGAVNSLVSGNASRPSTTSGTRSREPGASLSASGRGRAFRSRPPSPRAGGSCSRSSTAWWKTAGRVSPTATPTARSCPPRPRVGRSPSPTARSSVSFPGERSTSWSQPSRRSHPLRPDPCGRSSAPAPSDHCTASPSGRSAMPSSPSDPTAHSWCALTRTTDPS